MNKLSLIFPLFLLFLQSCQNKIHDSQDKNLENLLKKQLQAGCQINGVNVSSATYSFTENDMNISIGILKDYLLNNGFVEPNMDTFKNKILTVFKIGNDEGFVNDLLYLNLDNQCDHELKFSKSNSVSNQVQAFYITKKGNFITELYFIPEILDYETKFPELAIFEKTLPNTISNKKNVRWNSITGLHKSRELNLKRVLSRNKYLFNDNKKDLDWLLEHDKSFLIALVQIFGFDKEVRINELVLETLYAEYLQISPYQVSRLGDLFFSKNCVGELVIRQGLFEYVSNYTNENDNRFLYALSDFAMSLYREDLNHIFEIDPSKRFSELQRAKIVAVVASLENPLKDKYKYKNPEVWDNESTVIQNLSVSNPEVINLIVENKYFGYTNLPEILENIDALDY